MLDVVAGAMRADNPAFPIVDERQGLCEFFLASVAEELVVRHRGLPIF